MVWIKNSKTFRFADRQIPMRIIKLNPKDSFRLLSGFCCLVVIVVSLLVLAGWSFHINLLKYPFPGVVAMNPLTAVSALLMTAALVLLSRSPNSTYRRIALVLAFVVTLLAILKLTAVLTGWDLGIDHVLFGDQLDAQPNGQPNRMSPNTAFVILLLGLALWALALPRPRRKLVQVLALFATLAAGFAILGYLFGAEEFYGLNSFIPMAPHTAVVLATLGLGIFFQTDAVGLMALLVAENAGGVLARRLLPAVVVVSVAVAWVRLEGERAGLYSSEFGTTLYAMSAIVVLGIILWLVLRSLSQMEQVRQSVERDLRHERNLLLALMDNIPDTIYYKDRASRFTRINQAQSQVLGVASPAEAVGKTDFDFQWQDVSNASFAAEQALMASETPLVDFVEFNPTREGKDRWFSSTKVPLYDEEHRVIGLVGVSRDITRQKQTEQALKKSNQELESKSAELEATNRELEAFSYSVSHDLRSPLRSIDGFSQALEEDYGNVLNAEGRGYLSRVRAATRRMSELIDDLLTLSRLARGEVHRQTVDLGAMAREIAAEQNELTPETRVEFTAGETMTAAADPRLIRIVLENLLRNAWKFSGKQPQPRVEFGQKLVDGETVYFVCDNGVGFDSKYVDKLFGAFQRLHSATEFPGTGIGLAIVQRIIHRHHGRVWAEGKVNQGASFYFTLSEAPPKGDEG